MPFPPHSNPGTLFYSLFYPQVLEKYLAFRRYSPDIRGMDGMNTHTSKLSQESKGFRSEGDAS